MRRLGPVQTTALVLVILTPILAIATAIAVATVLDVVLDADDRRFTSESPR